MSTNLTYKPLPNIGINGLNTQENPISLDISWLTSADNIILRESGQVSFRKGLKQNVVSLSDNIGAIGEYKGGSVNKVFASSDDTIYDVNFASPDTPWTSSYTVTNASSDWQFIEFNDDMYALQAGHTPLRYTSGAWSTTFTAPSSITGDFNPSCGMGFYGRMWVGGVSEAKDVVFYSDTLIGNDFNQGSIDTTSTYSNKELCEAGGDFWNSIDNKCYSVPTYAGLIDLKGIWGTDEIVAIAPFYGKLVIFGKHNIVIYQNPDDPANMSLHEVVNGIGCVSRDSVVSIGDDLFFMSDTGLRSLGRTTQTENIPLTDLSRNIKDTIIRSIQQNPNVKSIYIENEGVYLASFVDVNITYIFDLKHKTPNGAPRITTWSFDSDREPTSMAYTESKGFLIGQKTGSIATYEGYFDKDYSGSSVYVDNSYTGSFKTTWINLGDSVMASILKKMKAVINGGSGVVVGIKWYKDLSTQPDKVLSFLLNPTSSGVTALFGASTSLFGCNTAYDYGDVGYCSDGAYETSATCTGASETWTTITDTSGVDQPTTCSSAPAKYTPYYGLKEYNIPLSGTAKHLQLEMSAETNGYVASLQNLTLLIKQGKIR
jgi:hypothetical protein